MFFFFGPGATANANGEADADPNQELRDGEGELNRPLLHCVGKGFRNNGSPKRIREVSEEYLKEEMSKNCRIRRD